METVTLYCLQGNSGFYFVFSLPLLSTRSLAILLQE